LPFSDCSFDLVILNGVLEWLGTSELDLAPNLVQEKCLKEIFRVLKPGGSLYIGVENRFAFFYFFGVKDPHSRTPFTTIMPRPIANLICLCLKRKPYRTYIYSLSGYRMILGKAGFKTADFYFPVPSYLHIRYLVPLKEDKIFDFWFGNLMNANLLFTPRLLRVVFNLVKMFILCPVIGRVIKYFIPDYAIIARKNSVYEN
jgi:SAM-dependent methyltransferase